MADGWQGMMKAVKQVGFAVGLMVLLSLLPGCGHGGDPAEKTSDQSSSEPVVLDTVAFPIKGRTFTLEVALDNDARTQGLSDRKSIADDGGMLFVFPSPVQTQFVMRRCYVPIDLIFIDEDGYIDSLHVMEVIEPIGGARWKNPHTGYRTTGAILYAVELKGGKIAELGLKRGEKIDLPVAVLQLTAQ